MAGPPGDADGSLQPVAQGVQNARELQQRRVSGRVVADADVPRVVVAVHEEKLVRIGRAADLGDRQKAG